MLQILLAFGLIDLQAAVFLAPSKERLLTYIRPLTAAPLCGAGT
ncbi:hypothetical protein ABIC75_004526 [Dyella japonica]|uniref:Uncharacterized protein n=1 Tax=Dyella japonica TaxID=231455 RepID=A0ABV2K124_9GAMM